MQGASTPLQYQQRVWLSIGVGFRNLVDRSLVPHPEKTTSKVGLLSARLPIEMRGGEMVDERNPQSPLSVDVRYKNGYVLLIAWTGLWLASTSE
jgi:hypothetical protein